MPKYLIRRRNQWGQYVHLATWDFEPTDEQIASSFGPGEYNIQVAREGIIGLAKVRDVGIAWDIEYLEYVDGEPTIDYIRDKYGNGNYYVLTSCRANPFQIFPEGQPHDLTRQHLQDGASVMKTISIIFRAKMPWV